MRRPSAAAGHRRFTKGDVGWVVCYEVIGGAVLAASNVFIREDGAWVLIHHQAGPCESLPAELVGRSATEPVQ